MPKSLQAQLVWAALLCAPLAAACADVPSVAPVDAVAGADALQEAAADAPTAEVPTEDVPLAVETADPAEVAQGWLPVSTSDLYGAWENSDGETLRRYEFRFIDNAFLDLVNITPAYRLYKGPVGKPLEIVERGEYKLNMDPALVTTAQYALDIAAVGKKRMTLLVPAKAKYTFELEVVPGITREFVRIETFAPFP